MKADATSGAKIDAGWIPELDGLRGIACALVVIAHFNPRLGGYVSPLLAPIKFFSPGNLGVLLFFCLSSFLLTSICLAEMDRAGSIDAKTFLLRRALRIWPLYFTVLLGTLFLISPYSPLPYGDGASTTDAQWSWALGSAPVYALFLGNWLQQQISEVGIFWTICVEEQFYFALPFVLPFALRRRYLLPLSIVATALALIFIPKFDFSSEGYYQTTSYISTFCLGGAAAVAYRRGIARAMKASIVGAAALAAVLILVALFPRFWWPPYDLTAAILFNLMPVLLVTIVYCIAINSGAAGLWILRTNFVRPIGILSFGIYLTHVLSHRLVNLEVDLLQLATQPAIVYPILFIQYASLATFAASVLYAAVERPAINLRSRIIPSRGLSAIDSRWRLGWQRFAAVSGAISFACLALLLSVKWIFEARMSFWMCAVTAGIVAATLYANCRWWFVLDAKQRAAIDDDDNRWDSQGGGWG